ncbi:MAG: TetR/AcrR family transcriptional regulator, partial [Hamadaea sp.]|nr:TetR/AcrR family transcriptional regulator [Hamadaea sp.]NUR48722.1 TetR/AcrR family transcriptional regulator [Hamadaea sp.]
TINPRGRRAQFAADEVPAHRRLSEVLDRSPDWDAEYEADLQDLLSLVRLRWGG